MADAGRSHFTSSDDKKMYIFLIRQLEKRNGDAKNPFGNKIWKLAEKESVTSHSYQSMLGRFKRKLWPSCDKTPLLTKEERQYLIKQLRHLLSPRKDKLVDSTTIQKKPVVSAQADSSAVENSSDSTSRKPSNVDGYSSVGSSEDDLSRTTESQFANDQSQTDGTHDRFKASGGFREKTVDNPTGNADGNNRENMKEIMESCPDELSQDANMSERSGDTEPFAILDNSGEQEPQAAKRGKKAGNESPVIVINDDGDAANDKARPGTDSIRLRSGQVASRGKPQEKRTRLKFSREDDVALLKFLAQEIGTHNPHASEPNGDRIWQLAAKKGVTAHGVVSMRDRFRKQLWPNLKDLEIDGMEETKDYLLQRLGSIAASEVPPQFFPEKTPGAKKRKKNKPLRKRSVSSDDSVISIRNTSSQKRIKVVIESGKSQNSAEKPHICISAGAVDSALTSMAVDGLIRINDHMASFKSTVDKLASLADKYKLPLTEVLRIAESVERRNLCEVEKILAGKPDG